MPDVPAISDNAIADGIAANPLKALKDRGAGMTIFGPRAPGMGLPVGDADGLGADLRRWDPSGVAAFLFETFVGVCRLPRNPAAPIATAIADVTRGVEDPVFVACNPTPEPAGDVRTGLSVSDGPATRSSIGRCRRAGDDPRLGLVQPALPHDRRA